MADVLRFDIAKDPKGNPITYGRVGDTDGLTRSVKVFEDGKPLDLTGYVITFEGNTSKYKTKVFDTGGVELVDATKGEFTYTFPNMAFAVEGQYERAYFSFAKSDTRKTTGDFEIIVFGNSDIDADEAETIITEYNRLVAELHALQEQAIDDMNQNFAEVESEMEVLAQKISDTQAEIDRALAEFEAGDFYTKAESDEKLEDHTTNIENPHRVTKDQVGLGQVTNDKQATDADFQNHLADEENPHNVTKSQVGLGNVPNYAVASTEEAEAGIADDKLMTPKNVKDFVSGASVLLNGDQVVNGQKDFSTAPTVNGSEFVWGFNETRVSLGADSNYDRRDAVFRRFGPIVLASFNFSLTTAGEAGWKTLMPFPTGYRPAELINVGDTFGTNSLRGYWCYVYANASGFSVIPSGTGTSGKGYQGTLVYMTSEPMPE